jgi:hypothetical protein
MILFKKREAKIEKKEKDITNAKQVLHRKINKDLKAQQDLINVLSNGIALQIKKGLGSRNV